MWRPALFSAGERVGISKAGNQTPPFSILRSLRSRIEHDAQIAKMRGLISVLFLSLFTSSVLSWGSKAKDGKAGECPYMQQKYAQEATPHAGTSCPLKDKCPLYAAVVHGESDIALDSLSNINWSEAAQSMSSKSRG